VRSVGYNPVMIKTITFLFRQVLPASQEYVYPSGCIISPQLSILASIEIAIWWRSADANLFGAALGAIL
jgi:hypothetical protein